MKVLFKYFILTALVFTGYNIYGQSNIQEAQFKSGDIELDKFLSAQFHEKIRGKNVDVCLISVTFAVFTIDTLGNIGSLTFSENKDTPTIFRDIMASVIKTTNGLWLPSKINGKAVLSKPFVLPLIYEMEAGCHGRNIPVNNGTTNALLGFLDFPEDSGHKINQLDCIFLRPLHIFSIN